MAPRNQRYHGKKRKVASKPRPVPIQYDSDVFVGANQAARFLALQKRKILPERRFNIEPRGEFGTFSGLMNSKKWDKLISPLEQYNLDIVREFYANALPDDDEPFTWLTRVQGRTICFDRATINRILGEPLNLGAEEYDTFTRSLRSSPDIDAMSITLLLEGKSVERNQSGEAVMFHREDMTPMAQLILVLILTNIKPKSHTSTVPIPVERLVHSILTNVQIDVARIIANELKSIVESGLKAGS